MTLPETIAQCVQPLLDAQPIDEAMGQLVVTHGASKGVAAIVNVIADSPSIASRPALCAGLWLYVDELDRSHAISQSIEDATGSFWHGIMHRREGDFGNSHYWFNRVGTHPAMSRIAGYDAHKFIDDVDAKHAQSPAVLVDLQRKEWAALFSWCAEQGAK